MRRLQQRETLHRGAKFDFERLTLVNDRGETLHREVIRHPGAVVVVPFLASRGTGESQVVLIRNQRYALNRELWEFPAGTMEPPEPAAVCAGRELEEEAGYRADTITALGSYYTTPGMTDELMHAYLATGLTLVGQQLMDDEEIRVEVVPLSRALAMLDSGDLMDAKSMLALLLALRRGLIR